MGHRPVPEITDLSSGFWAAARRNELAIQRCQDCRTWFHPPVPVCLECQGEELAFEATGGTGTIYATTTLTADLDARFADEAPLQVLAVELDEQAGLVVVANLVDSAPAGRVGDRCVVVFRRLTDTVTLAQFRLADGAAR